MRHTRIRRRRRFRFETLEARRLLAGDLLDAPIPDETEVASNAADTPFQNPANRLDVNNNGIVSELDALTVINELNSRNVSQPDGTLPSPAPDPIPAYFDVNGDNLVTDDDAYDIIEHLGGSDFGDAPESSQSGLSGSYPTLLSDDGARHITNSLFLGTSVSSEQDGVPTALADGDSDDDGVTFLTPISGDGSTAELSIESSGAGILDAWIDFNRDGDWSDAGERIFEGVAVENGTNRFSFDVGGGVSVGTTFARFRLSSDGVSAPTGRVNGGEVEDYAVEIVEDDGDPLHPSVEFSGTITIQNVSGDIVVSDANGELFRRTLDNMETLTLTGSDEADTVTYDRSGGPIVPQLGLTINGAGGGDTLIVVGGANIDATLTGLVALQNLPFLDMTGPDASTLLLDASVVAAMAPGSETLIYSGGANDDVEFADAVDWRMADPIVDGDAFWLTAVNQITGEEIIADVPSFYTNLIDPNDVNNDGNVSAVDANVIITELGRRTYSTAEVGTTVDPTSLDPFPNTYADQNHNLKVTALDALRIINEIARRELNDDLMDLTSVLTAGRSSQVDQSQVEVEREEAVVEMREEKAAETRLAAVALELAEEQTVSDTAKPQSPDADVENLIAVDQLFGDRDFLKTLT